MAEASTLKVSIVGDADKLRRSLDEAEGRLGQFAGQVKKAGKVAATGMAAAGAAAVTGAFKVADFGDEVAKSADKAGLGVEQFQELRFAFKQGGVETGTFDTAMQKFNKRLGESATTGGTADEAFQELGVSLRDADGGVREASEAMDEVLPKLAQIESDSKRAAVAGDLFGQRAGPELAAALSDGVEGIDQARQKAQELGIVMDEEATAKAEKFSDAWDDVKQSALGMMRSGLTPVMGWMADDMFPFIQDKVIPALRDFRDWVGPKLSAAASGAASVIESTVVPAFHAMSDWWDTHGPTIIEWAVEIGETISDLGSTVKGWWNDTVKPNLANFRDAVEEAWPEIEEAGESLKDVFSSLGSLVATIFGSSMPDDVSKGSGNVRADVDSMAAAIEDAANTIETAANVMETSISAVETTWALSTGIVAGDAQKMAQGLDDVSKGKFSEAMNGLRKKASDTLSAVAGFFGELPGWARDALAGNWAALAGFVTRQFSGLKAAATARVQNIVDFVGQLPAKARDVLARGWSAISGFVVRQFSGLKTAAVNRAQEIVDWFRDLPDKLIDAMGDLGGRLGGWIGDQFDQIPGVGGGGPQVSGPSGGPTMGGEMPGGSVIRKLSGYMESTGIPHRVTSTYRPGDSGYHGQRRAVDFAGMRPGWDSPSLREIQRAWVPLAASGKLKELIGPIESLNYKNGRQIQYPRSTELNHKDHVHTAMAEGGVVKEPVFGVGRSGATYSFGEQGPETVTPQRGSAGATQDAIVAELRRQNQLLRELAASGGNQVDITVNNPEAEPAGETVERQLKRVEAVGLFGTSP